MKRVLVWMGCGLALLAWAAFAEQAEISLPGGAVARFGLGVVQALAYSPNGEYLAVATSIGVELRLSDTYELIRTLTGHTDGVNSVAFSPDGALLASGSRHETIKLHARGLPLTLNTAKGTGAHLHSWCLSDH